jgi:uncharacterized protein (TIGR02246 family)
MKNLLYLLIVSCLLSSCKNKQDQTGTLKTDSEVIRELHQLWQDYIDVSNSGDLDKLMTFFTYDYVNMPSASSTQTGPDELRTFMSSFMTDSKPHIIHYLPIEDFVHDDMAYEFGKFDMYIMSEGSDSTMVSQRSITVFKKNPDGKWKFHRWMGQQ